MVHADGPSGSRRSDLTPLVFGEITSKSEKKKEPYFNLSPPFAFILVHRGLSHHVRRQDVGGFSPPGRARSNTLKTEKDALSVLVWRFGVMLCCSRDAPAGFGYVGS